MSIRLLTAQDGPAYQQLRLKALLTHPDVYFATFDQESTKHESAFAEELDFSYHPPEIGYYGLFGEEDKLHAFLQVTKSQLNKQEHIVLLYNFYVDSDFQRQGFGSQLISHVETSLKNAHHQPPYRWISVDVVSSNRPAINFYRRHGYQRMGVRKEAMHTIQGYEDIVFLGKKLTDNSFKL